MIRPFRLGIVAASTLLSPSLGAQSDMAVRPQAERDATVHLPGFSVPPSRYMSQDARRKLRAQLDQSRDDRARPPSVEEQRIIVARHFEAVVARARTTYPVTIDTQVIAGIPTQIVVPQGRIPAANRRRVLIELHGGSFLNGAGWGGLAEAVPIASIARTRVISVDYRMAPEHHFPAASDDVVNVYRQLLKRHRPQDIGIFGCSAGGILTAMTVASLQREGLPRPGAIAMFSAGAFSDFSGDPAVREAGAAIRATWRRRCWANGRCRRPAPRPARGAANAIIHSGRATIPMPPPPCRAPFCAAFRRRCCSAPRAAMT